MRAGVLLLAAQFPGQSPGDVLDATVQAAVAAELAGFDDVWFAEHHFMSYGVCPSAATLAAYVLGQTERIAVGTAVSVLSTAHPVALAEQATLLDQVSGGRFWLASGLAGYRPVDGRPGPARDPGAYAGLLCDIHPVGTAADCIDSMAATIEHTDIRHLLCMVEGAGDPARTRENIARLGAEVLPVLRQRFGSGPGHPRAASSAQALRAKAGST